MMQKEKKIIENLVFIRNIIRYCVLDDVIQLSGDENKKQTKLEEKVFHDKRFNKKTNQTDNPEFLEKILFESKNKENSSSLDVKKKEGKREISQNYSFVVKYQENENGEKLKVEIGDDSEKHSFEIIKNKKIPDKKPYQLDVIYENNNEEEKLGIRYSLRDYPTEREEAIRDFTSKLDKSLSLMPKSLMGGMLGFTYLGENFMSRRDDLTGDKALMVDVHEAIHTDNEYETRVLTDWMLTRETSKYKR